MAKRQKTSLPVLKKMVGLSLSGLALLAALAWNNTIQEITNNFVKNYVDGGSGIVSLLLYGLFLAVLFVITAKELAELLDKIEEEQNN